MRDRGEIIVLTSTRRLKRPLNQGRTPSSSLHRILLAQHHHGGASSSSEKDPAIAAALSLQPLPIDLGSFYAGNWERGILYTAAEVTLFVPAIVMISENSNWFGHHRYNSYYDTDP